MRITTREILCNRFGWCWEHEDVDLDDDDDGDDDNDGAFNERHFLGSSPGQHSPLLGHCSTLATVLATLVLRYTNTNTQTQIHKYKYTNTNTQKTNPEMEFFICMLNIAFCSAVWGCFSYVCSGRANRHEQFLLNSVEHSIILNQGPQEIFLWLRLNFSVVKVFVWTSLYL